MSPSVAASPSAAQPLTPSPVVTTPSPTAASSAAHGAWVGLDWQAPVELAPYESVFDVVAWGGGYVNYFSISGRSYKVIPQVVLDYQ